MAARSIASLSLSFGLVSIPVRLYSATESASNVRFHLLSRDGSRLKQQYVSVKTGREVERSEMVKGYEFEKDRFVLFEPDELKALEEAVSHTIEIVSFIPEQAIDPLYYDKAYLLTPDKRGGKSYSLLVQAMQQSGRCALARWAWKGKQYVVQVRAKDDGLVLHQLLYAQEVRSLKELEFEKVAVSDAEVKLALQLIEQIAADTYDPTMFEDEEKSRILAAIDRKVAGQQIVAAPPAEEGAAASGQVIDLMQALRASLRKPGAVSPPKAATAAAKSPEGRVPGPRKAARRAEPSPQPAAPARSRARK